MRKIVARSRPAKIVSISPYRCSESPYATRCHSPQDRKSTRLNSSHGYISYAVFCLNEPPHTPTLFPYTTLFRSGEGRGRLDAIGAQLRDLFLDLQHRRGVVDAEDRRQVAAGEDREHQPVQVQREPVRHQVPFAPRSEEHTSELQSRLHLVCRLLLERATSYTYALSLHDALPIWRRPGPPGCDRRAAARSVSGSPAPARRSRCGRSSPGRGRRRS